MKEPSANMWSVLYIGSKSCSTAGHYISKHCYFKKNAGGR